MSFTDRSAILVGDGGLAMLAASRVAVYGLGGVGAACAVDLVRMGVGTLKVVDFDLVEESNLNRLAYGTLDAVGRPKTEAFAEFARRINPRVKIEEARMFFSGTDAESVLDSGADVHAECVDSLTPKVMLIAALVAGKCVFISSMGMAGRLAPERLKLGSLAGSSGCPLAREVRNRLRRLGVGLDFPVVWSDEPPVPPRQLGLKAPSPEESLARGRKRLSQGSSPFVPQVAGHFMASWIVRTILSGGRA